MERFTSLEEWKREHYNQNYSIFFEFSDVEFLGDKGLQSCLCFDPSVSVESRVSRIADMNCARSHHSLVAANGKLYAIGGVWVKYAENGFKISNYRSYDRNKGSMSYSKAIDEYDPAINEWKVVGEIPSNFWYWRLNIIDFKDLLPTIIFTFIRLFLWF